MPLRSQASRSSKLSHSDWACSRVRPSPRSLNRSVSSATLVRLAVEGEGLHDPVRPDLVEAAVEAEVHPVPAGDVAPAAAGAGVPVARSGSPVRPGRPTARTAPGRCARGTAGPGWREVPGDPDDRERRVRLDRRLSMVVSSSSPLSSCRSWRQDGVQPAVALLGLPAVTLDPRGHQVEDLRLQMHRAAVGRGGG